MAAAEPCPGCGGLFPAEDGGIHPYMLGSPGCWARYGRVLAREYADPALLAVHRLSVDAYAVQHPGVDDRRAVQSVGLHLARLWLQLERRPSPRGAQAAMVRFAARKATLPRLNPPAAYTVTAADMPLDASADDQAAAVEGWARAAWTAWWPHHDFIGTWARAALDGG